MEISDSQEMIAQVEHLAIRVQPIGILVMESMEAVVAYLMLNQKKKLLKNLQAVEVEAQSSRPAVKVCLLISIQIM